MRNFAIAILVLLMLPQVSVAQAPTATLITLLEAEGSEWTSPAFPQNARTLAMDLRFASMSHIADVTITGEVSNLEMTSINSRWCVAASCSPPLYTSQHTLVIRSTAEGWTASAHDNVFASGTQDLGDIESVQFTEMTARQIRVYTAGTQIDTTFSHNLGGFSALADAPAAVGGGVSQGSFGLVVSSGHASIRTMAIAPSPGPRWLLQQDVAFSALDNNALGGFALAAGLDSSGATLWRVGVTRGVEADVDPNAPFRLTLREGDTIVSLGSLAPLSTSNQWIGRVTIVGDAAAGELTFRFVGGTNQVTTFVTPVATLSSTSTLGLGDADVSPSLSVKNLGDDGSGRAYYSAAVFSRVAVGVGP